MNLPSHVEVTRSFSNAAKSGGLDVAMRALYELAQFSNSVSRIGMTGPDVASYVNIIAWRAISHVETAEKEIAK